ncbi:MAG: glycosyl hydrolase [Rikenellaceae bacterium]
MKKTYLKLCVSLLLSAMAVSCGDPDKFFTDQTRNTTSEFDLPMVNISDYKETVEFESEMVTNDGEGYTDTYVSLKASWLTIDSATPIVSSAINLGSSDSRLVISDMSYEEWSVSDLKNNIYVNGIVALEGFNIEVRSHYNDGVSLKVIDNNFSPVILYAGEATGNVEVSTIYKGGDVPLSSSVDKLLIKRGYQVVVAASEDGTDSSVCYIAVNNDVEVELDASLKGNIKFLRTLAIDYVNKRGIGGKSYANYAPPLNLNWFYTWGANTNTNTIVDKDPYTNYMPMFWSCPGDDGIQAVIDMQCPVVLFLNEPDNVNQSNVDVDKALEYYAKVHAMGVRLVTPSCCEIQNWSLTNTGTASKWINAFMAGVKEQGLRYDGVGMHWYSYSQNYTTGATAANAATAWSKLNASLTSCYNLYKKPIFLTEFNFEGGTEPSGDVCSYLLENGVLPGLESAEYVERYALFPPETGSVSWLITDGELNDYGEMYCNRVPQTPSIVMAATDK